MNKEEIARRIYDLGKEIKGLVDEKDELREDLAGRMAAGDIVRFNTPEGLYRASMGTKKETTFKGNEMLLEILGRDIFMASAKVGCGSLKEALKEAVCHEGREKELLLDCIRSVAEIQELKILKGGG